METSNDCTWFVVPAGARKSAALQFLTLLSHCMFVGLFAYLQRVLSLKLYVDGFKSVLPHYPTPILHDFFVAPCINLKQFFGTIFFFCIYRLTGEDLTKTNRGILALLSAKIVSLCTVFCLNRIDL